MNQRRIESMEYMKIDEKNLNKGWRDQVLLESRLHSSSTGLTKQKKSVVSYMGQIDQIQVESTICMENKTRQSRSYSNMLNRLNTARMHQKQFDLWLEMVIVILLYLCTWYIANAAQ